MITIWLKNSISPLSNLSRYFALGLTTLLASTTRPIIYIQAHHLYSVNSSLPRPLPTCIPPHGSLQSCYRSNVNKHTTESATGGSLVNIAPTNSLLRTRPHCLPPLYQSPNLRQFPRRPTELLAAFSFTPNFFSLHCILLVFVFQGVFPPFILFHIR